MDKFRGHWAEASLAAAAAPVSEQCMVIGASIHLTQAFMLYSLYSVITKKTAVFKNQGYLVGGLCSENIRIWGSILRSLFW